MREDHCLDPQFAHLYAPVRRSSLAVMSVVTEISNARGRSDDDHGDRVAGSPLDLLVDAELIETVHETLASGWWSMGPRVGDLEDQFAAVTAPSTRWRSRKTVAALHLALLALGCGAGDEVVLSSLNFVAATGAHLSPGQALFCDILGSRDLNTDPDDLAAAIGPRTKAVVLLHYAGYACDLPAVSPSPSGEASR